MMYRRLQRFVQGRPLCVVLACALVFSSVGACLTLPVQSAYAGSAALEVGHKIEYGSWDTNAFIVNGMEAYCGAPSSKTPESGTYEMRAVTSTVIAAGLWYGYGGPGFDESLWPQSCPGADGDDAYRVMTHVALAYLASDSPSFAYEKCDGTFQSWCDSALFGPDSICERIRNEGFTINGASGIATQLPQGFTAYEMNTGVETQVIYAMGYHPLGNFTLQKVSARPSLSDGNGCYFLAGAHYGIFTDASCTHSAGTITTDASGTGRSPDLELGTYYIKELNAPVGYALSPTVTTVRVNAGANATTRVENEPQSDPVDVLLCKADAETGEPRPLGGASLEGAEYTVRFYAERFATPNEAASSSALQRTWVLRTNASGEVHLNEEAKVSGDEFFTDAHGRIVLPLGTLIIEETTPPRGYLRNATVLLAHVSASGDSTSVDTYQKLTHPEQVIRGDLSFVKAREADQIRLAGIPFRLTSNTTGESHILVTDENGEVRTTNAWNPHCERTNANDAAVTEEGTVDEALLDADTGVWFGPSEPRNDLGALPFDTYTLAELSVTANTGLELITIPSLTIKRDGYEVDWGTLDDQPSLTPTLRTHASDALDGDKTVTADSCATVVDEVHYAGVEPGKEYRVAGHLVERASSTVIADDAGVAIGNEAIFLAEAEQGALDIAFTFDASEYADSDIVVLEELTDLETGEIVAAESNLNDAEQTVHIAATLLETPSADKVEDEQPLVHTAGAQKSVVVTENPADQLVRTGALARTGDALFPIICCCFAVIMIAGFTVMRRRKISRRKRLRASLRTGV